jgi:hypothetical protein
MHRGLIIKSLIHLGQGIHARFLFWLYVLSFHIFCLQAAPVVSQTLAPGFEVHVQSSHSTITLGDVIQVTISIKYPEDYQPGVQTWLDNLQAVENPSFDILSHTIDVKSIPDIVKGCFSLTPNRTGVIIWAPGIIQFTKSNDKSTYRILLNPISVICLSSPLTSVNLAPLLPLYPEKVIQLNEKMHLITFDDAAYLKKQQEINNARFEAHKKAWTVATIILLAFAVMAIVFWIMIQYDLLAMRHKMQEKKEDPLTVAKKMCVAQAISEEVRWETLLHLFQIALGRLLGENLEVKNTQELKVAVNTSMYLSLEEKTLLLSVVKELDDVLYAHAQKSQDIWNATSRILLEWVEKRVG